MKIFTKIFWCLLIVCLCVAEGRGQTLYDSFGDGNFTASPVWGGNTTLWTITASDAAAGAAGSNTLRLNGPAVSQTDYLSSQIATWGASQEWGFFVGRRGQAFTAANQMYIWLYANESTLNNATVDGYRLAIGDDTGNDDIRLEYYSNGAVSATVITSSGAVTNGLTDIGFLVRVTRSSSGVWTLFTSTLPTSNGNGAIATDVPNSTNATVNQGSATNNTLVPASSGYIGVAALHSTGAAAIIAVELDQIYFTPGPAVTIDNTGTPVTGNITVGTNDVILSAFNITPAGAVDFTAVNVATSGSAVSGDIGTFRIFYDADASGGMSGGDASVSGSGIALANPLSFTITGQTGFSAARRYFVVANVTGGATHNITASIAAATDVNTTGIESGTAAGNQQNIVAATSPTLSAGAVSANFGNVCINTTAGTNPTFTITGSELTSAALSVSANAVYTFATTSGGSYSNPLNITQSGCSGSSCYTQTIYIHFTPTAVQSYNGPNNITVSGGGASSVTTSVDGSGVNTAPTVTTGSVSGLTTTTATPAGTINANGCTSVTAYGIEWSGTSGFTNGTGTQVASSNLSGGNFSSTISSGLSANTTYYFKAYATNGGGTGYGSEGSFITYPDAPTALGSSSVTSSGFTITWTQASGTIEDYEVEVHDNSAYTSLKYTDASAGTADNAVSETASGLSGNTQYWYRVRSRNNGGTQTSAWVNGPASVTTLIAPCQTENFSGIGSSAVYGARSWSGVGGTWTASDAREDQTITGKAITIRAGVLTSPTLTSGVNGITLTTKFPFSEASGTLTIAVNSVTVGTITFAEMSGTTPITKNFTGFSYNGNVVITATSSGARFTIDDFEIYCPPATADINVKGNSVSIADADNTPSATDHTQFTDTEAGLTSTRTFTIENAGSTGTINISSVSISGTVFTITTPTSDNALTTGESTTFTVTFAPTAITSYTETVTIVNDDPDASEQSYTFDISGNGTVSLQSVATAVSASEANTISSIVNTTTIADNTQGTQVWQFRLYDGNGTNDDGDGLPTIYTGLTINMGSGNTVTSWSAAIQSLKFFEGTNTAPIAGTVTVGASNVIFTPTTPISVSDGAASNKLISIRLSLKNPLPASSDGLKFVFQLQKSNVTVQSSATSSQLANFSNQISDNTKNVIDVTGTVLQFVSPPTVANVNVNFTITVAAYDANGNADLSNTGSVTLSKTVGTGTFTVSNATSNLSGGTYSWTDASHNTAETITLQAAGAGFNSPTTNIVVQSAPYILFDNFNRTSSTVGTPSSGGSGTWTEDEGGTGCPSATTIIRTAGNQLELSNCNQGNTLSCGTSNNKQISFNMVGRYPTIYDNSPDVLEWYVNLSHTRTAASGLSGFGSGSYGVAYILGSTEQDFNSGTAQGYALVAGNTGTPDPLKLISFNGQPGNPNTTMINSTVDFLANVKLSVRVTFNPATDTWSLQVRDDGASFTDPTNLTGYPAALTTANSDYITKNLKYYGAFWNHGASCEEIMYVDNAYIPSVPTVPEIQVTAGPTTGTTNINDGDTYDFGPVNVTGGTFTQTFTITNTGLATLLLQGSPNKVVKSGTNSADFTVTQPAAASLAPGASTTFTVAFDPSAAGARTATLTIDNNDGDEDPFVFNLTGTGATPPVINEFVADHTGTDTKEFMEVFGANSTAYTSMTLLVLEGDAANRGTIDNVFTVGTTDAAGYWWTGYQNSQFENPPNGNSMTVMLVMNFSGSLNQDLDANDDGTLDVTPWTRVVDDVGLRASAADKVYSTTIITPNFDGTLAMPGGISRIPNGTDNNVVADWMRNDIDGWGLPGFAGTANANEAKNTPNRVNTRFNVWLGVNTTWNNASNWTVRVPNDTTEALVPSVVSTNYPVINVIATFDCFGLYLTSSASTITLSNAGAEIRNHFDFETNGSSNNFGVGLLSFEGSTASTIKGTFTIGGLTINNTGGVTINSTAIINITDKLSLNAGQLTNSGALNLKSSATKTAYIDDFTDVTPGTLSGNVTIERYVPTGIVNNFHYIGSASGGTASKWTDDFPNGATTAIDGAKVTPRPDCDPLRLAFNSVYGNLFTYDEALVSSCYLDGWRVRTGTTSAARGTGFAAVINNGVTLDETGAYSNATVSINGLSVTGANGVGYSKGYHLVANPFFAPIDWNQMVAANVAAGNNMDGTAYIYNPNTGTYGAYNLINSGQVATNMAFFVRNNPTCGCSTFKVDFVPSTRTTAGNNNFLRQGQPYAYGLKVKAGNGVYTDETLIAFDGAYTDDYDNGYDANKLLSAYGVPSLYTLDAAQNRRAIEAIGMNTETKAIPLGLMPGSTGNFDLTFEGIQDFPSTVIIWLEDLQTGSIQYLRQNNVYSFAADTNENPDRFVLHFTPPVSFTANNATCVGNDGQIGLTLPAGVDWSFTVHDAQGLTIIRQSGITGLAVVNALPAGTYTVELVHTSGYSTTESIVVNGVQTVNADFTASSTAADVHEDIEFTSSSTGANNYEWDFGDGTVVTGDTHPLHAYSTEGAYTVTLRVFNNDCEDITTQLVHVYKEAVGIQHANENRFSVYVNDRSIYLDFDFSTIENAEVTVSNLLGQQIYKGKMTTDGLRQIDLERNIKAQYLAVSIKTSSEVLVKKVFFPGVN